ncbi:MAG: hypothetical protein AB7K52_14140 [Phycisphaerales bacterium]
MRLSATVVCLGLSFAAFNVRVPEAAAMPAAHLDPTKHDSVALFHMELREPVAIDAVLMAEEGKVEEAIAHLKKFLTDPTYKNEQRQEELRIGLGMVHMRSGQIAKAEGVLKPIASLRKESFGARRAQAIIWAKTCSIQDGTKRFAKANTREEWAEGLRVAKRELFKHCMGLFDQMSDARKRRVWNDAKRHLREGRDALEQARVIRLDDELMSEFSQEFVRRLNDEIAQCGRQRERCVRERREYERDLNRARDSERTGLEANIRACDRECDGLDDLIAEIRTELRKAGNAPASAPEPDRPGAPRRRK